MLALRTYMHHTWKLLTIIFVAAIVGLGIFAANNPNLQARLDQLFRQTFGENQNASSSANSSESASSVNNDSASSAD